MHELMFQAGVYKRNERAKRAHSLYVIVTGWAPMLYWPGMGAHPVTYQGI